MFSNLIQVFVSFCLAELCFSLSIGEPTKHSICAKLLPEKLEKCEPETEESPYSFVAECRKDWSYCIVKVEAPDEQTAFEEAYVSAEALHCEDKRGKLMGHFRNVWPGSEGYYERMNYYCGNMNRNYKDQATFNLFNPVSVSSKGDMMSPMMKAQFSWKKIADLDYLEDQTVVFKATVVQSGKKFWTNLKATVIVLME